MKIKKIKNKQFPPRLQSMLFQTDFINFDIIISTYFRGMFRLDSERNHIDVGEQVGGIKIKFK